MEDPVTHIDDVAPFTAEDAAKLIASLNPQPNRAERRANTRALRRESSKVIRKQYRADSRQIVAKRAWLRRHYGNPAARQKALVAYFVAENAKRGYE